MLSRPVLRHIAEAVTHQVNHEFSAEWGNKVSIRVGTSMDDVRDGEWVYGFEATLPGAPSSSAFHDIHKHGIPYALCGVTTCRSLYGPHGISVDASHEILETAGDEGANQYAYDNKRSLHAMEMCDAVEVQTYPKTCRDGTIVHVSNWLLPSWFIPRAIGPYDYMTKMKIKGAAAPPGPLRTAPGRGGNYQIVGGFHGSRQETAILLRIAGTRRKGKHPHWSSRTARRLARWPKPG